MNDIGLLIIGAADDGPKDVPVLLTNLAHAERLFGGYNSEYLTLTTGATGLTLSNSALSNIVHVLEEDSSNDWIPSRLFESQVSGTAFTWTKNGDWDRFEDVDPTINPRRLLRYQVLPPSGHILRGIYSSIPTNAEVYGLRLGGEIATVTASGWTFSARYAGSRYNGTTVTVSGGVVTVNSSAGTGNKRIYTPTSDYHLKQLIRESFIRSKISIEVSGPDTTSGLTIPNGTWTLSGGTSGSVTSELLNEWLDSNGTAGIEIVSVVDFTTQDLLDSGIPELVNVLEYPTLFVGSSTVSGTAASGVTHSSRVILSVPFRGSYYTSEGAVVDCSSAQTVAALISLDYNGGTLAGLPENLHYTPVFTKDQLVALSDNGHIAWYHSIGKGPALWYTVNGDSSWPVSVSRSVQEISRRVYHTISNYIGKNIVNVDSLNFIVASLLTNLTGSTLVDWKLGISGSRLLLTISIRPNYEIRVFSFSVTLS